MGMDDLRRCIAFTNQELALLAKEMAELSEDRVQALRVLGLDATVDTVALAVVRRIWDV